MQIEPEIAFRGVEPTEGVKEEIRSGIDSLEQVSDQIMSCRIMVEMADHRQRTGNLYRVSINITLPGHEIIVNRAPAEHLPQEDLFQAIGEAFDRARQQLIEQARKTRGDVKAHETPSHGHVVRLFPEYGFIDTADGREVYFHRNSLISGDFDDLEEGSELRFAVEQGTEGPQATSVRPIGKHHPT